MNSTERKIYLSIFVCLLVSLIGTSFAYFTAGVSVTGSGSSVQMDTASLVGVTYNAGTSALSVTGVVPGTTVSKTFTVAIAPATAGTASEATYNINYVIATNSFANAASSVCSTNCDELVYTLKETSGGTTTTLKTNQAITAGTTGTINLAKITHSVSANTTYTYTLEITYLNKDYDQNHNQGKELSGNINVEFAE